MVETGGSGRPIIMLINSERNLGLERSLSEVGISSPHYFYTTHGLVARLTTTMATVITDNSTFLIKNPTSPTWTTLNILNPISN